MAYRKVKDSDLVGKTVKSINVESTNVLALTFTDGTKLKLWAELAVMTQFGSIPGIFAETHCGDGCSGCSDCFSDCSTADPENSK